MSDKPLTPEERAWKLWEDYQQLWASRDLNDNDSPTDEQEAAVFEKHIAAAVADVRKDERAKYRQVLINCDSELSAIAHGRPPSNASELDRISWECRKLWKTIQQEPTQ